MAQPATTAQGRYEQLSTTRSPYLERARDCAALTIPALLPPEGANGSTNLPKPYQSMGARGVNNLASKLLLALLPPNQPFFRLLLDDALVAELAGSEEFRTEVEAALGKIENAVMTDVETTAARVAIFEALKQLIATGNVCLFELPDGGLKTYRLDRYVVKRAPNGDLLELVVHEKVSPSSLPPKVRKLVSSEKPTPGTGSTEDTLDLYTWVRRDGRFMRVHQEIAGHIVPQSEGEWPVEECPFVVLRWTRIDGEDYGRGHAEEYYGDLRSCEALQAAIVEGSAAAAKVVIFVDPTGVTQVRTVSEAPNLAVRPGKATDVTVLKIDKANDFTVALNTLSGIERRLAQAFLMTSSVQRQAERVTAEEVRLLAGELEDALGGVYALLAQELQLPFVRLRMARLANERRIPKLPPKVKPAVVTGMEALGRSHEVNRLLMFGRVIREILGDQGMAALKPDKVSQKVATSLGIPDDLLKTAQEMAQEQQQAQRQAMLQAVGPELAKNAMTQQQQEQQPSGPPA
ncbi:MAG TPA: portal protein [Roseomonas sp.]|nr:portal protein [Roseomonas sp.]